MTKQEACKIIIKKNGWVYCGSDFDGGKCPFFQKCYSKTGLRPTQKECMELAKNEML